MLYYLIVCRSLTYAQRTAAALERAGVSARPVRSPRSVSSEGCSHCVRIPLRDLDRALTVLRSVGLEPKRVFAAQSDGSYTEMLI